MTSSDGIHLVFCETRTTAYQPLDRLRLESDLGPAPLVFNLGPMGHQQLGVKMQS